MRPYLLPLAIASVVIAATGVLGYAIWQNHKNRRDINRIIRPSPDRTREGIDRAIERMTPEQAAAIFGKLPAFVRAELRGSPGRRGPRGPRGAPGRSGAVGSPGRAGSPGRSGDRGLAGVPAPQITPRRPAPSRPQAPRPQRAPTLVPRLPAPFPPEGGRLPNGKPCPPRNPRCG